MSDEDLKILKKDFPKIIEIFNFLRSNPHIAGPLGADQKKLIELRKKHTYRIMNTAAQVISLEHLRFITSLLIKPLTEKKIYSKKSAEKAVDVLRELYQELEHDAKVSLIPLFLSDGYFLELVPEKKVKKYKEILRLAYIELLKEDGLTFREMKNSYIEAYPSSKKYPFLLGSLEEFNGKKFLSHEEAMKIEKNRYSSFLKRRKKMETKWNSSSLKKRHEKEMEKFLSTHSLEVDEPRDLFWWLGTAAFLGFSIFSIYYLYDLGFEEVVTLGNASGGAFIGLCLPIVWFFFMYKAPLEKGPHKENEKKLKKIEKRHNQEKSVFLHPGKI